MDNVHVRGTATGQAPPLASLVLALCILGAIVGLAFWPVWPLTALAVLWVVRER